MKNEQITPDVGNPAPPQPQPAPQPPAQPMPPRAPVSQPPPDRLIKEGEQPIKPEGYK